MKTCEPAPRRPRLRVVPLRLVWPPRPGRCYVTMAPRQWDGLLQEAYAAGYVLLEINKHDRIPGAFCKDARTRRRTDVLATAPDPDVLVLGGAGAVTA